MTDSTDTTQDTQGFDLADCQMSETAVVTITHPTNKALQAHVTIRSVRSKAAKAAMKARPIAIEDGKVTMDDAAFEDSLLEQTIAVTEAWDLRQNGEPLPCTPDNVRAVYTNERTAWIQGQVQSAYLDLARFFETASAV